jgi:hypothetical protein
MDFQWFNTEHHRLHIIEEWPDSPHKEAALAASRSKLESLARNLPVNSHPVHCEVCLNREDRFRMKFRVIASVVERPSSDLAA